MKFQAIASLALITSVAFPLDSHAADVTRDEQRPAADICRPALPAYDGRIRVRPLGLVNESSGTAFVTCALTGHSAGRTNVIELVFMNPSAVTRSCTLVSWRASTNGGISALGYQAGSTSMLEGYENHIRWTSAIHNGGAAYASAAISCALSPGDGIRHVRQMFVENIGQ
ncbi:hypothetical protein WCE34_04010 [Luteimonas sp. MJ204]|uniref:hypothetical protein n=1 Tax=Luteimonas TaxID=83614 RepID=UPI0031BB6494